MKAAGLTHGAFYAHFGSKEALQVAAVAYGQKVSLERVQRSKSKKGKGSYANRYLSRCHRDNPGDGCTMAALAQEVARASLHISIRVALTHFLRQKGPRTRHGPDELSSSSGMGGTGWPSGTELHRMNWSNPGAENMKIN